MIKYRPDIDGLRSIAVLSIFIFHINPQWMPGGYVGVDIFFVISGFLIGGIVFGDLEKKRFSIIEFYHRRFKRIIPALFAMLAIVTIASALVIFPVPFTEYARSMVSATFSVSNIYFWKNTNYFDAESHSKPLLHTWSLGVEEQFYIFFPLVLWLIYRTVPRHVLTLTWIATFASLVISEIGVRMSPDATFYLLPTRAWELLLGFLIVLMPLRILENDRIRNVVAIAGGLAIMASFILYDSETRFPGISALLPCLGSAALIATGRAGSTWPGRLLSLRPLVAVGLISYSLYLWHWPLIVLLREAMPISHFTPAQGVLVFAAGLLLGYLSWRFVEQPFRSNRITSRGIFTFTAAGAGGIALASAAVVTAQGVPQRFAPPVSAMAGYLSYPNMKQFRTGTCFLSSGYEIGDFDAAKCLHKASDKPNVLILGDSHAAHLWWGLQRAAPDLNIMQATASGCQPTLVRRGPQTARCDALMTFAFDRYLRSEKIDLLVLAGLWTTKNLQDIGPTLAALNERGIRTVVVGPVATYDMALPKLAALSLARNDPSLPGQFLIETQSSLDAKIRTIATEHGATYFSAYRTLCPSHCLVYAAPGVPTQFDYGHLTKEGSDLVGQQLAPALRDALD